MSVTVEGRIRQSEQVDTAWCCIMYMNKMSNQANISHLIRCVINAFDDSNDLN